LRPQLLHAPRPRFTSCGELHRVAEQRRFNSFGGHVVRGGHGIHVATNELGVHRSVAALSVPSPLTTGNGQALLM